MKFSLRSMWIFLCILCLISIMGVVIAQNEDQFGQTETYDAYPGTPTPTNSPGSVIANPAQSPSSAAATTTTTPTGQSIVVAGTPMINSGVVSSTSTVTAVYSTQAPPATQQDVFISYNIQSAPPTAVYYSGAFIPWVNFYQTFSADSPMLWIATSAGWSWYAACPLGSWVQEVVYVPATGIMKIYELCPDGTSKYHIYGWTSAGYKYRWFYADTYGRYTDVITIANNPSNYVTIDVM